MYSVFLKLLTDNNVKTADVCKATGISSTLFSEWKKGKATPKIDKLQKIADYFNVSVEYLRTGVMTEKDDIIKEAVLDAKISNDTELKDALEIYYRLNDRDKQIVLNTIKMLGDMPK